MQIKGLSKSKVCVLYLNKKPETYYALEIYFFALCKWKQYNQNKQWVINKIFIFAVVKTL